MSKESYLDLVEGKKEFLSKHKTSEFMTSLLSYNENIIPYLGIRDNNKLGTEDTVFYALRDSYVFISCDFPEEAHQIAHMVEISDNRLMLDNWGMPINHHKLKMSVKSLLAATARECRVRAIQSLMRPNVRDQNVVWNPHVHDDIAPRLAKLDKFGSIPKLVEWYNYVYNFTLSKWSLDRIEYEWKRRIDLIQNNLHSKIAA